MNGSAAADGPLRAGALVRATPVVVWLVCALHVVLGATWAVLIPALHAPDEHAHADLILDDVSHLRVSWYGRRTLTERIERAIPDVELRQIDWRTTPLQPWDGLSRDERLNNTHDEPYVDLDDDAYGEDVNQAALHPPLYYGLVEGLDIIAPGSAATTDPWWHGILRLRLFSVLLTAPVPWFAFWIGTRLRSARTGLTASLLVLAVPQLSHLAGSVNNDALLMTVGAAVLTGMTWMATGDRSRSTAALTGALAGVAALTKVFGMPAVGWVGLVALLQSGPVRDRVVNGAVVAGGALAGGLWWPVRQWLATGSPVPRNFAYPPAGPDFEPDVGYWLGEALDRLTATFWGRFGIEQFDLPYLILPATIVAVVAATFGVVRLLRSGRWRGAVALLLPIATSLPLMMWAAWTGYVRNGLPAGIRGRYLFVGIAGLVVLVAVAVRDGRRVPRGALVAAAIMQGLGLGTVLFAYYAGSNPIEHVVSWAAWAPGGKVGVAMLGVLLLTAATACGSAVWSVTGARHRALGSDDGLPAPA